MESVRILQLTDLHVFAQPHERLKGIPTRELLLDVVAQIQQSGEYFDHVVVTGDHTHDELPETYQVVRSILNPWIDRLWQVPGNHDDRTVLRNAFADRIIGTGSERIQFSFMPTADWLCLGIDTHSPGEVKGLIIEEQISWIQTEIQKANGRMVALFMHHPPIDLQSVWMDRIGLVGKERLQDLIAVTPQIRLICCGHVHHESSHLLHGANVVTTPSTGLQFSPNGDTPTFVSGAPGYRIVELSPSGFKTSVHRLAEVRYEPVS